jgi:ubiquinone/menaquinone biosynthesis C-methylase UbiE
VISVHDITSILKINKSGWDKVADQYYGVLALPNYGPYALTEDELKLLGDVQSKNILEIGCGSGHSLLYMATKGAKELWGIDLSTKQIEFARELLSQHGLDGKLFELAMEEMDGLPENYFDIIYSIYALGWTANMSKTLSHIYNSLKMGGVFVFSWDHPMQSRLEYEGEQLIYKRSYLEEGSYRVESFRGVPIIMHHRKVSTIINELANVGFKICKVVEESRIPEDDDSSPNRWYSGKKAEFSPSTLIIRCKK